LRPSKGIHLTVRRDRAGIETGIAFFEQTGNSNVFLEPWQDDLAFVGTTDTPYEGDLAHPRADESDIQLVLERVNQFLHTPLERDDVLSHWAGLRPLVESSPGGSSQEVSRSHLLIDAPGLVTITGGKLTAYRSMAEDAVDAVSRQLGVRRECTTIQTTLDGAMPAPSRAHIDAVASQLAGDRTMARHLLRRHGKNTDTILKLAHADEALRERIHDERPYIAAEVLWGTEHEQARNAADVLERRTRIQLETRIDTPASKAAAARVSALLTSDR
jgi:glycerol-3-phosphate dehydrogenase